MQQPFELNRVFHDIHSTKKVIGISPAACLEKRQSWGTIFHSGRLFLPGRPFFLIGSHDGSWAGEFVGGELEERVELSLTRNPLL